jgi:peptide/nickel transport system permease protein
MELLARYLRSPASIIGAVLLVLVVGVAVAAPFIFPKDPLSLAGRPLQWPMANPRFALGTDPSGRDIAALIFHGARVALLIGLVAAVISIGIGIVVGAVSGFYGGWVDTLLMRIAEAFQTLPSFLLLLVFVAVFGSDITTVTVAIGLVSWPAPARLTRAEFLSLRNREFVQACRVLGMRDGKIIFQEMLPNALPPVIVYGSIVMATAILLESALAFLSLSDPNIASWGNLIGAGRGVLRTQWYVSAIPGVAILLTVLAVSLVGQGLNDALNPQLRSGD